VSCFRSWSPISPTARKRLDRVNIAINIIQITALVVFSVLALGYRMNHPPAASPTSSIDFERGVHVRVRHEKTMVDGKPTDTVVRDKDGVPKPKLDAAGKPVPFQISYPDKTRREISESPQRRFRGGVHNIGWAFVQATIAILILVGFESVTAMGGEARNAKRTSPSR